MAYDKSYFTVRETWRDWRIEARWLIEHARVSPGARVLEIGCGGGGLLQMLRARGARVVGVDTLGSALALARTRRAGEQGSRGAEEPFDYAQDSPLLPRTSAPLLLIQIGKDNTLPFRDAAFDAIIGQHIVEHLPDADAALREWKRLLAPKGRLALATPNALYPDPAHFADADHARVFAPAELRGAAERAGLVVESCQTIFPFFSRVRGLRALGVLGYQLFQNLPYMASHGRTLLLVGHSP